MKPTLREQYNRFRKDFDRLGGMLPPSVAARFLGVSRQRMHQLIEKKQVRTCDHEGPWVSLSDVVERMTAEKSKGGRPRKEN